jgi:UDP-N-acetylmuramoylalanine--D-glutamate ligase
MKKVVVIGLGISGQAASELLLSEGKRVIGVDCEKVVLAPSEVLKNLQAKGLTLHSETEPLDFSEIESVVVSPGIPPTNPLYACARECGIEVIGEAELSFKRLHQPCIGITGTNGKTTVTLLVEHILNAGGVCAKSLGNVGDPLATYVSKNRSKEVVVAELSSYQLETMHTAVFDAGVILNITPDHLDRYADMNAYAEAKCRLKHCMKAGAPLYVHCDVEKEFGQFLKGCAYQSYGKKSATGFWTDKSAIFKGENIETFLPLSYRNKGTHESENALAAWLMCQPFGVRKEVFLSALETFKKPSHRIEYVMTIDGVAYYDDSKGTNIDAVVHAVNAMQGPVLLIAGGVDKGASYISWASRFQNDVKRIITIGQAAEKIFRELGFAYKIEKVGSLKEAVELAAAYAKTGDNVLLSPGCSSFDMFRDYKQRGEEFKHTVYHLEERRKQ